MGILSIRELKISCIVGIYPHERKIEQNLFVDVDMEFDFTRVDLSDHLADTVDYTEVASDLTEYIRAERFQIIETLAQRCCARILGRYPALQRCKFVIRKPGAVLNAQGAIVTVEQVKS